MNLAIFLFFLVIILYISIADIFTILFRLTGMTEEMARLQVISLLTNSGFTTKESEIILETRTRRNLAKIIMIFGYAFSATIVSSIVTAFISLGFSSIAFSYMRLILLFSVFILFASVRKIKFIKKKMDWWIESFCYKHILKEENNTIVVLEEYGEDVVATVVLRNVPECMLDKTLVESEISKIHEIMVILIKKPDGTVERANAVTILKKDDMVMVLGKRRNITKLFKKG
jgi:hypothetical protein